MAATGALARAVGVRTHREQPCQHDSASGHLGRERWVGSRENEGEHGFGSMHRTGMEFGKPDS